MTEQTQPQIGDIWKDCDKRVPERYIVIHAVGETKVQCYNCDAQGRLTPADDKRYRNGHPRSILISRLRLGSTGYQLFKRENER